MTVARKIGSFLRMQSAPVMVAAGVLLFILRLPAAAQPCAGDCNGNRAVAINELIIGVNIALGNQAVSACESFDTDFSGTVAIHELIAAVNNALKGCPAEIDTPTATAEPTDIPTDLPTSTPTGIPTGTVAATLTPTETPTHTTTSTATPMGIPTGTAAGTFTPTDIPEATPTTTGMPTATFTRTELPHPSPTPTATATTGPPPGESVGGRAAIVVASLGSFSSVVGTITTALTADDPVGDLVFGTPDGGGADIDQCPEGGTTGQACSSESFGPFTLTLTGADCAAAGPSGGLGIFTGTVALTGIGICSDEIPPILVPPSQQVGFTMDLEVRLLNASQVEQVTMDADLNGSFVVGVDPFSDCFVETLDGAMSGTMAAALPDGTTSVVEFDDTDFLIEDITYNDDCVPLIYTITFDGPATFTELDSGDSFDAILNDFVLAQDATGTPVLVEMSGGMESECFGGELALQTFVPVAIAAGELCPTGGQLGVSAGTVSATVTYTGGGGLSVDDGTEVEVFANCLDPGIDCP